MNGKAVQINKGFHARICFHANTVSAADMVFMLKDNGLIVNIRL